MTSPTYFYAFPTEQEALAELAKLYPVVDGKPVALFHIDWLGTLYTQGEYDENGEVVVAPVARDGYHFNTPVIIPELEAWRVTPQNPSTVYA